MKRNPTSPHPMVIPMMDPREDVKKIMMQQMTPVIAAKSLMIHVPVKVFQTITQRKPARTKAKRFGWKLKAVNRESDWIGGVTTENASGKKIATEITPDQKNASITSLTGTTAM